jgi:hypothetical protein
VPAEPLYSGTLQFNIYTLQDPLHS